MYRAYQPGTYVLVIHGNEGKNQRKYWSYAPKGYAVLIAVYVNAATVFLPLLGYQSILSATE